MNVEQSSSVISCLSPGLDCSVHETLNAVCSLLNQKHLDWCLAYSKCLISTLNIRIESIMLCMSDRITYVNSHSQKNNSGLLLV